jgi:hypothetical protein
LSQLYTIDGKFKLLNLPSSTFFLTVECFWSAFCLELKAQLIIALDLYVVTSLVFELGLAIVDSLKFSLLSSEGFVFSM